MYFYLLLMLFLAAMSISNSKSKSKFIISSVVLAGIMGLKNATVGNDTRNYIELYHRLQHIDSWIDKSSRFEKGYQVYNKILGMFFDNEQALFIVTAIICIFCISYGVSQSSENWQYSLFLFVSLRFYYFFLSGLRQSMAASIVFLAYTFLKKDNKKVFIALVLLATTFHFSAAIFLFALPLYKMKITTISCLKVLLGIFAAYIFFGPILSFLLGYLPSYYSHYLVTEAASANNLGNFIGAIIPCVFLLFAYFSGYLKNKDLTPQDDRKDTDSDTQILFLIISAGLSLLATRASILDRMVQYYWLFGIISVPNMIFSTKDHKSKVIISICVSFFVILYNIVLLKLRPEWNMIVPYEFYWQ